MQWHDLNLQLIVTYQPPILISVLTSTNGVFSHFGMKMHVSLFLQIAYVQHANKHYKRWLYYIDVTDIQ